MRLGERMLKTLRIKVMKSILKGKTDYELLEFYDEIKRRKYNNDYDELTPKEDCEAIEPLLLKEIERRGLLYE